MTLQLDAGGQTGEVQAIGRGGQGNGDLAAQLFVAQLSQGGGHPGRARLFFLMRVLAARIFEKAPQGGTLNRQICPDPFGAHLVQKGNRLAAPQPKQLLDGSTVPPEGGGVGSDLGLKGRKAVEPERMSRHVFKKANLRENLILISRQLFAPRTLCPNKPQQPLPD
jgi:hypothetical protein